MIFNISNFPSL